MKKGTCKFYNGNHHNARCDCGVLYRDVTSDPDRLEGSAYRKPCIQWDKWKDSRGDALTPKQLEEWNKRGECSKYQEPSDEEVADHEATVNTRVNRFMTSIPLISRIKKERKGSNWKGIEKCPVCEGKLHMTHSSYNGHVWGKCETENCLNWLE
jgi:hypothetical protein